ncbi:MAG: biotin carboxylase [Dehalococcoidia bacterium]|nr:biotin carboxylase [Dehalococcoidia bacterium]
MEQQLVDDIMAARAGALAAVVAPGDGRLAARERVARICDPGSFQEYGVLAQGRAGGEVVPADGLVGGTARIHGEPAVVVSYDVQAAGGTQAPINQAKLERLAFIAAEHGWPFVCFADGQGDRTAGQAPSIGLWLGGGSGRIGLFDGLCELSGAAPSIAIVSGEALDGHAAIAMFSECVIATRGSALGTSEGSSLAVEVHETRGDIDILVDDEPATIDAARRYLSYFVQELPGGDPSPAAERIGEIVPENRRRAYDMRRVIDAIADEGSVLELRRGWGPSLITSLVRMGGRAVGVFANQPNSRIVGAIDAAASDKMARFIELCDAYGIPLVSLIDSPGFYIGQEAERDGIARHHVRTLAAIEHREVPLYCVQIRKAYGLGPLVMRGSWGHLPPDLRLAWPTVETGGMSLEGAAYLAKRKEILAAKTPEEALAIRDAYANTLRERESGVRAGQNFSFDDIIHPAETRDRIIAALQLSPRTRRAQKKTYIDTV